jgi:hypothetical protein
MSCGCGSRKDHATPRHTTLRRSNRATQSQPEPDVHRTDRDRFVCMWGLCVRVMCKGELWRGGWGWGGGQVGDKWARRTQKGKTTDAVRWHHRIRISEPSSPQASGSKNVSPTDDTMISLHPPGTSTAVCRRRSSSLRHCQTELISEGDEQSRGGLAMLLTSPQ